MSDHPEATSDQDTPSAAATAPITVEQAAAILGVSITTVKRRIRSGALRAEEAHRPQGTVWMVYLPSETTAAATSDHTAANAAATIPTTTTQADAMVSLIQTTIGTILGPLVTELAASRQTNERQSERIEELAREVGELKAENRALTASTAPQSVEPATEPPYSRWRAWEPRLLALVTLAIAVALLVWLW
jgi:hypothetical protein